MPNVNVTYEEMRDASRRLTQAKEEMSAKLSELRSMVQNLVNGGYVTDSSSKQFDHSYTEFNDGAVKVADGLEGMGKYLNAAADTFQQADDDLAKALNK